MGSLSRMGGASALVNGLIDVEPNERDDDAAAVERDLVQAFLPAPIAAAIDAM